MHGYTRHNHLQSSFAVGDSGIYAIINRDNGKVYIGSAIRLNARINVHRTELWQQRHHNRHLQKAYNKNPDAFDVEIIEVIPGASKSQLVPREQFWIDFYNSTDPLSGYNICPKADSCQGVKHGPEFGERIRKLHLGRKHTEQARRNMKLAQSRIKRKPRSLEARINMSIAHRGFVMPEVTKKKLSEINSKNAYQKIPVSQFSKDGQFIKRFEMIRDAEKELNEGRTSNIHGVLKGKRNYALGFVWKYA